MKMLGTPDIKAGSENFKGKWKTHPTLPALVTRDRYQVDANTAVNESEHTRLYGT